MTRARLQSRNQTAHCPTTGQWREIPQPTEPRIQGVSHRHQQLARSPIRAKGEAAFFSNETQERSVEVLEGRIAELERFCGQLSLENTVLKKAWHLLPESLGTR